MEDCAVGVAVSSGCAVRVGVAVGVVGAGDGYVALLPPPIIVAGSIGGSYRVT
jgi:hypothetical protein